MKKLSHTEAELKKSVAYKKSVYFDNNLQKIFRKNILENGTGQILFIVVLMVGLLLKLLTEVVD